MQRTMRRIGALVLALAMLVTFMPVLGTAENAHAEEEEQEQTIDVFVTISDQGTIATGKGDTAMAWQKVTVKDLDDDEKFTFHEALVAAHETYFPGGPEEGYAGGDAGWVTKLWGVENNPGSYSFTKNGKTTDTVNIAEIESGDYLVASINQDGLLYSDWATFFDTSFQSVQAGESADFTLSGFGAMTTDAAKPISGAMLVILKDGEPVAVEDAVTDENGKASLTFDEPGSYVVSAIGLDTNTEMDVEPTYGLMQVGKDKDDKTIYGRITDWQTYDYAIGYTEEDYGDGPYPVDKLQWIASEDFDAETFNAGHLLYSGVVTNCPLIAPACVVSVAAYPVDVYVTVNNKGVLAESKDGEPMFDMEVRARDIDMDSQITVDEALIAAHEKYYKDGVDGYATEMGKYGLGVTKLWGVDTTNTLFFVDEKGLSMGVGVDTVENDQSIYASVNKDDVNFADVYCKFNDDYDLLWRNEKKKLTLESIDLDWPMAVVPKKLAGVQVGTWENGAFKPIEGAVTDENGEVTISFAEAGSYLITAQGTVKGTVTDWTTGTTKEVDCPIMAPFCDITVQANEDAEAAIPVNDAIEALPDAAALTLADKDAVAAARAAYNKLTDAQKSYVYSYNLSKLELSEAVIDKLQAEDDLKNKTKEAEIAEAELKEANEKIAILEKQVKKVKVTGKKKKLNVSWKSLGEGYKYQVYTATKLNGKFKKAKTVSKNKATIKNLKSKKTYYVKVRGYKKVNGKTVYTQFSDTMSAKTK